MGKSLVFQLPVLASGGIGIVISPLIALMQEQSSKLIAMGAFVLSLGGRDASEAQEELRDFPWKRGPAFLFLSPERAETDGYLERLLRRYRDEITLIAIDEAHCISQWGHDFRPPYKAIPGFLDRVYGYGQWPTLLCLTATLDSHSQAEILADFRLKSEYAVRSDQMLRTNLDLSFQILDNNDAKLAALDELLAKHRGEKIIVYAHLKQNKTYGTRALARRYDVLGYRCAPFDADLPGAERDDTLEYFRHGDLDVVFATGAFGMGIDISDIRGVVHFLIPESLEQYYQEVGRAGRDEKPAFGVVLYTSKNAKVRRDMIKSSLLDADDVRGYWEGTFQDGKSSLRTLSPWVEFQGREMEHSLFYAFQRVGALKVVARGPGRLSCFEPRGPEGAQLLARLGSATKTGNITAAIRKLGLVPNVTMDQIFDLYDRGELKLVRSPDKTLLFETSELSDDNVKQIVDDISAKTAKRRADFDSLVELVEAGGDPTRALQARFGEIK
jgi:ATP-dependent DNA helicase RecQ